MRRLVLLLCGLLLLAMPAGAQDDPNEPNTYVTRDGLVLTFPADWRATEYGVRGFVTLANHPSAGNPDLDTGEITLDFTYTVPAERPQFIPPGPDLIQAAAADFISSGGTTGVIDVVELPTTTLYRMRGRVGDDAVTLYTFVVNRLPFSLRAQTGDTSLVNVEQIVFQIIGALRFDSDPLPAAQALPTLAPTIDRTPDVTPSIAEATTTPDITATPTEVAAAALPQGVFWVQNIEATDSPNGIGALDEVVVLDGNTLLVSDSFTSATVQLGSGTVLERIPGDPEAYAAFLYVQFGPDRVLYGYDTDNSLVRLRADLSVIQKIRLDGPAMAFVRSMDFSPDGDLYIYGLTSDGEITVLVYDTAGRIRDVLNIDSVARNTLFSSAAVIVQPDGNLLYIDAQHDSRLLSPDGVLIRSTPLDRVTAPAGTTPDFVAPSMVFDDSGRLLVLSGYGLTVYDTDGRVIGRLDTVRGANDSTPFAALEMPARGDLALVPGNIVAVVGSNGAFSLITLLNIDALVQR